MRYVKYASILAAVIVLSVACRQKTPGTAGATTAPFVTSLDQAKQMAIDKNQLVLLDFYTNW